MIRLGINGFGRTGRAAARIALERDDVRLVAINSRSDATSHAYLLKYDSVHGTFPHKVTAKKESISIDKREIRCFQYGEPKDIPWDSVKADIIIESTGVFKKREQAASHLRGSVKKVIISTPSKDADKMIVMGVNEHKYNPKKHDVISNASCTTNCLAILCKVIVDNFGIKRGFGTTIHAPTQSQRLLDSSHNTDKRRGRAAFLNVIPTTTGAAKALGIVIPELKGKLDSFSVRIPVGNGSLMVLNAETKKPVTKQTIDNAFVAATSQLKGYLEIAKDEMVSQDIVGNHASAVYDPFFTRVIDNNLLNIYAWYDNEMGYSTRLIDLTAYIGSKF